jgi:hypothetical protein
MPGGTTSKIACALALVGIAATASNAQATTICVPGFGSACPNSGGNVAVADVEQAMSTLDSDGKADEIVIAAGTFTEGASFEPSGGSPGSYEPHGSDPLTIVGAGPAQTTLTSGGTGNIYLFNLSFNNSRKVTIRDLTLQAPASLEDGGGGTIVLYNGDILENVDIASLNPGTDGVSASGVGNVYRGGEVRGEGFGSIDYGIATANSGAGLLAEDDVVSDASWALVSAGKGASLTVRRIAVEGAATYGAIVSTGTLSIENSTFRINDGVGLFAGAAADPGTLNADHVTVVNSGGTDPALEAKKFSASAGAVELTVSNSILRGFGSGYKAENMPGPGIGTVSIEARYSNLPQNGTSRPATSTSTPSSRPISRCNPAPLRSMPAIPWPAGWRSTSSARRAPLTAMGIASIAATRAPTSISERRPRAASPRVHLAALVDKAEDSPPTSPRRRRRSRRARGKSSPPARPNSPSNRARPARASSASSTARSTGAADRRAAMPVSSLDATRSECGRSTPPATATRLRPNAGSGSHLSISAIPFVVRVKGGDRSRPDEGGTPCSTCFH